MKKLITCVVSVVTLILAACPVMAEDIAGRVGVTGRLGFFIPADSDYNDEKLDTDAGFAIGGGVIYGIDKNWAAEVEILQTWFASNVPSGADRGDFAITDLSFGGQYRLALTEPTLVPYGGAGLDILINDYDRGDVDTVVGIHVKGGVDYFIMPQVALNAEARIVLAPEADIESGGSSGNFDPSSFAGTFGLRFFF